MNSKSLLVIKIGGTIIDSTKELQALCKDIHRIHKTQSIAVVHGGNTTIQKELDIHGVEGTFKDGLRITSQAAMNIVEMALCGTVNTHLVRTLHTAGLPAVGITGADAGSVKAEQYSHEHKQTGKVSEVQPGLITHTLSGGYLPVIAPIGTDSSGNAMNINADWVASAIASALSASKLIYISDQDGILDDTGHTIQNLSRHTLTTLMEKNTVQKGMLTKTKSIIYALNAGISSICIVNGKRDAALLHALDTMEAATGTHKQDEIPQGSYKQQSTHITRLL